MKKIIDFPFEIEENRPPKKINWSRIYEIWRVIAMAIICIAMLSFMVAYYELKEDYNWAKEHPLEFNLMNK